jgi:hypothetical protein
VTNLAGTTVTSGNASGTGAAARTYTLTVADTATLDTLSVTFDPATSGLATITETVEVVGHHLFSVAEARASDPALADTARFTTARIEAVRAQITEEFETICGVSFVPRYRLDVLSGTGFVNMALPRMKVTAIRSVEYRTSGAATWTAYTADDLADLYIEDYGWVLRETRGTFTTGRRNIRIGYEYGYEQVPYAIKQAALTLCRYKLVEQNATDRTLSMTTEFGTTQLSTPNPERNRWYGILSVDTTLALYPNRVPAVA